MGTTLVLFLSALQLSIIIAYSQVSPGAVAQRSTPDEESAESWQAEARDSREVDGFRTGIPAVVETTPAVCSGGVRCGFQIYEELTREFIQPFISYCSCPEGTECVVAGDQFGKFYYYKCRNSTDTEEMTTAAFNETETASQSSPSGRDEHSLDSETPVGVTRTGDAAPTGDIGETEGAASLKSRVGLVVDRAEL